MHGFLHHCLAAAAGLAACALAAAPWTFAAAQPTPAEISEPDLRELEGLLSDLGFDPGPVDGVVDEATLSAIKRYQEFASLPGDPEPSQALLAELRGVAAAFAALRSDDMPDTGAAAPAADASETTGNAPEEAPRRASSESDTETAGPADTDADTAQPKSAEPEFGEPEINEPGPADKIADKVIVPPPPIPPKLKPLDAVPEITPEPAQTAALPPDEADGADADGADADGVDAAAPDPVDARQALIDAELAPYREGLANRSLTREDLAKQFNILGRQLLQAAEYDAAILKFDVAIHLNPRFAGAYSNRGTAYELQKMRELAAQDFDKARQLGFGGVRPKAQENPLR